MADSAVHEMKYVAETTVGETPTSPTFKALRGTGTTLEVTKSLIRSEEQSSTRQVQNVRHGVRQTGGDLSGELWYGDHDDLIEALFGGTWAVDTPIAGTDQLLVGNVDRSFSILSNQTDISTANKPIHLYKGQHVNTWNLSFTPDGIVSSTFGLIGIDAEALETEPSGSTTTAASNVEPMTSLVGSINIGGVSAANVTEATITIENGMEAEMVCMNNKAHRIKRGQLTVSGQFSLYFENSTAFEAFLNETELAADISVTDPAGNTIKIDLPALKYSGASVPRSGSDSVVVTLPFEGFYDETATSTIVVERTPV